MAQQLVFTSAPAGLAPGSSGYCTVARSEAMREAVAAQLERWSVYAHAARGPRPVICAHRVWTLRGSTFHVLSRIVDSGLDHTGRTNFLAHHLVVQPHELHGAPSPAAVFQRWGDWRDRWTGAPGTLEDVLLATIPAGGNPLPARTWQEAAGDAGAATLLVNETGTAARSVGLVVNPGQEGNRDLLPRLFAESLSLLDAEGQNPALAWSVPFTTHLQAENDPGEFRWRGTWPEAAFRVADDAEVLVDFPRGVCPAVPGAGKLLDFARTGRRASTVVASTAQTMAGEVTAPSVFRRRQVSPSTWDTGLEARESSPEHRRLPIAALAGGATALLAMAAIGAWWWQRGGTTTPIPQAAAPVESLPTPQPSATPPPVPIPATPAPAPRVVVAAPPPLVDPATLREEAQKREEAEIERELDKLPKGAVYWQIGPVGKVTFPKGTNPWTRFHSEVIGSDGKTTNVEWRYGPFAADTPPADPKPQRLSAYGGETILKATEDSYEFKEGEAQWTSEQRKPVPSSFIWLTLRSGKMDSPIHFFLAENEETANPKFPRLSRKLLVESKVAPPVVELKKYAFERLKAKVANWGSAESWQPNALSDRLQLKVRLRADNSEKTTGVSSIVRFEDVAVQYQKDLAAAELKVKQAKEAIDAETDRQTKIINSRNKLKTPGFPQNVQNHLKDSRHQIKDTTDGYNAYATISGWLETTGGDVVRASLSSVQPKERLEEIRKVLKKLDEKDLAIPTNQSKPANEPPRKQDMRELVKHLKGLLNDDDFWFLESNSANSNPEQLKGISQRLALQRQSVEEEWGRLKANPPRPFDPTQIESVWWEVTINGRPVHLIEFVQP